MGDHERIPKLLRAVTHPDEFEPFRHLAGAAEFEERWTQNAAWALANLAHAAYHPRETIERLLEKKCGAHSVHVYEERHAQGFLAVWPERAVLAFRGTRLEMRRRLQPGLRSSIKTFLKSTFNLDLPDEYRTFLANDVLADLMFIKKRQGDADVHQGFLGELEKLWPKLAPDLDTETSPAIPVFVTGHSLGGAMATIAGMRRAFTEVVTFGEPRVGSNIASEFQAGAHTRYINGDDPITTVPPAWWPFSYEHHGRAVLLEDPDGPNLLYDHAVVYYAQNLEAKDA